MSYKQDLVGLSYLKTAFLLLIVNAVVSIVFLLFRFTLFLSPGIVQLTPLIVILPIAFILQIFYLYYLRKGFTEIKRAGKDVGIGRTGTTLLIAGIVLLLITLPILLVTLISSVHSSAITTPGVTIVNLPNNQTIQLGSTTQPISPTTQSGLTLIIVLLPTILVLLAGGILALVGAVLVLVGLFKLGSAYNEGLVEVGSILTIIPILNVAAGFLLYFGVENIINRLKSYPPSGIIPPTPMGKVIYQQGQGTLSPDGIARVSIYSSVGLYITYAQLITQQGAKQAISINPPTITPGVNQIEVNLGPVTELPKDIYALDLLLSDGSALRTYVSKE